MADHAATVDTAATLQEGRASTNAPTRRPERFGRYEVTGLLGRGGCGTVYGARDPSLGRDVAIKSLRSAMVTDVQAERIRSEAIALAQLSHPNVVPIYDVGEQGGTTYIVMQKIEGPTLRRWLAGRRSADEIVRTFVAAGEGLHAAHDRGLIHRDFKPDNVLLDEAGRPRVVDFGLVRGLELSVPTEVLSDSDSSRFDTAAVVDRLTQTGAFAGTPAYMAPERFKGRAVDERVDQFSFCVALYEALEGQRPFRGDRLSDLVECINRRDRSELGKDSPYPAIMKVIRRGLASRPERRYPSMRALLHALSRARGGARARRPFVWASIAGLGIAFGVLAVPSVAPTPRHQTAATAPHGAGGPSDAFTRALGDAQSSFDQGHFNATEVLSEQAVEKTDLPPAQARALALKADAVYRMSRGDEAREVAKRAYDLAQQESDPQAIYETALVLYEVSKVGDRERESDRWLGQAAAEAHRFDASPRWAARLHLAKAMEAKRKNELDAVSAAIERGLQEIEGLEAIDIRARLILHRADLNRHRVDVEASKRDAEHAHRLLLGAHGPNDPRTLRAARGVARLLADVGDAREAIRQLVDIRKRTAQLPWDTSLDKLQLDLTLAFAQYQAGLYDASEKTLEAALVTARADPRLWALEGTNATKMHLMLLRALGRPAEALPNIAALVDDLMERRGPEDWETIETQVMLAVIQGQTGDIEGAERTARAVLEYADTYPNRQAEARSVLCGLDIHRGKYEEALAHCLAALDYHAATDYSGGYRALARRLYAQALLGAKRRDQAITQIELARGELQDAGPAWWKERADLIAFAAGHGIELEPFDDSPAVAEPKRPSE